jgi:hypothetical protein
MDQLEFRLLGSIDAYVGGRRLEIGPRKRRYVLAALLLDLNRPVSVERLIDAVWEGTPPDSARMTVQGHVYRLRRTLPGVLMETEASGYVLRADPERVDALRTCSRAGRVSAWPSSRRSPWRPASSRACLATSEQVVLLSLEPGVRGSISRSTGTCAPRWAASRPSTHCCCAPSIGISATPSSTSTGPSTRISIVPRA